MPPLGDTFDDSFLATVARAQAANAAIHDGAIIVSREGTSDAYRVTGWSYRLIPPNSARNAVTNRGSAYNSAISMSLTRGVDAVALISTTYADIFISGRRYSPAEL
jgi:hypothetical protein